MPTLQWQTQPTPDIPTSFIKTVAQCLSKSLSKSASESLSKPSSKTDTPNEYSIQSAQYAAQLLWQRGIQDPAKLPGFVDPSHYQPTSPSAFGAEMAKAIARLQQARQQGEKVAIWGDFDADGITATAVLWEGLAQFFTAELQLIYFIPNRLTESHGLAIAGIKRLAEAGVSLIITCDTGSANLAEINYADTLGIEVIITDHHSLPTERPPVVAIINPRYLPSNHPLATLSGVAVAYKLIEALTESLPEVAQQPLKNLLDLVAIGLIADLVELKDDCRYLAQLGIQQLQNSQRPGIVRLLELCKRNGDRPTDISFGIGPRINAISRIQGDARFCVELLTSQDIPRCRQLAEETELANTRRKSLQKELVQQVRSRLVYVDLSTTSVIVLADEQWSVGILGLVAGQIAQEYGKPVILLTILREQGERVARGSARSLPQVNLYQLVKNQAELLHGFGGHPMALGLSLPLDNLALFTEAINRQLRQQQGVDLQRSLQTDLTVTVADLGQDLFRQLKVLEPYGMGNPVPKLLLQNIWFERVFNRNIQDFRGKKQRYIKTEFELWDETVTAGFPGLWWEHYADEIPKGRCDAIVELDFNAYQKRYEIRLVAVRPAELPIGINHPWRDRLDRLRENRLLDWRKPSEQSQISHTSNQSLDLAPNLAPDLALDLEPDTSILQLTQCPHDWNQFQTWLYQATQQAETLAIAYALPVHAAPAEIWQQLVGIAKYLSRTGLSVTRSQITAKLGISESLLSIGFEALKHYGFAVSADLELVHIHWQDSSQWNRSQPDSSQQDSSQPDSSQWNRSQPDSSQQNSSQPDSSQQNSSQPDSSRQNSSQPDSSQPDSSQPDSSQQNSSQWNSSQQNSSTLGTELTQSGSSEKGTRSQFLAAVQEAQFRQQYFCQVPLETLRAIASQAMMGE